MIHIQTGNDIDLCCTYEGSKKVIKGLYIGILDRIIPLPDPEALLKVLQDNIE